MLEGTTDKDWLKYNASYDLAGERHGFKRVGKNVRIHCLAIIPNPENISIGDNVRVDAFTILSAHEIVIGNFVHIGAHCVLTGRGKIEFQDFSSMSHGSQIFTSTDDLNIPALTNTTVPFELQRLITENVLIEKHAIVGASSTMMPGTTLGFGAVIGAKSYVRLRDRVKPYTIVAGCPAKFVRERSWHISATALSALEQRCVADC